jgi:hypothetical protein
MGFGINLTQIKNIMKNLKILSAVLLLVSLQLTAIKSAKANNYGYGTGIGIDFDIVDDIFTNELSLLEDHLFVSGEVFGNYYNNDELNYNYGFKGNLGYKILGIEAYGVLGVQNASIKSRNSGYFKTSRSPVYGFGVAYNLPIGPKIKLENNYFTLDQKGEGTNKDFSNTTLSLVFMF